MFVDKFFLNKKEEEGKNGVPKIARIFLLMQNKLAFTYIHSVKE